MECNKEEAVRARGIAEQKMQNGDFEGAKKFALKAQKLFPELENISQLLTVCNVHYCAKQKLHGSEMDWYGILQIEQSADETFIKKQYRKLALLLHPDKNKFAGAEAAFKLIGEANRILTDQTKRSQYDMKCRVSVKTAPKTTSHPSNRASSVNQYEFTNNYQNGSSKFTASFSYQQTQHLTFSTLCSACGFKYQYLKDFVNRLLCCPTCGSTFIARDLGPQGYSWSQFSNQQEIPNQGPCKVSSQSNGGKPSGIHVQHRSAGPGPIPKVGNSVQVGDSKKQEKVDGFSSVRDRKKGVDMPKPNVAKPKVSETSRNAQNKRGRKSIEESDDSCETGSKTEIEDSFSHEDCRNYSGLNSKVNGGHPPRRSSRQKQHVSYEEKLIDDDDDFVSPPYKRSKVTAPPNANEEKVDDNVTRMDNSVGPTAAADICRKEFKQKASAPLEDTVSNKKSKAGESKGKEEESVFDNNNKVSQVDTGTESSRNVNPSPEVLEYPDPEFSDFEKHRAESCFSVNQVWAIYDTLDGMPRFYAQVKKVLNPGFKLRITWLEADPDKENELNWVDQGLPVSCGRYCYGSSETCVDRLMFSHRIDPIKRFGKHLVYPQKGETWALFRDWDLKWSSEPEKHKPPYQYDFVEVLTDFDEEIGIGVAHLGKVKGFISIFRQTERDGVISFQVSSRELYRFSHRIPSCRMTGKEREGVPLGSFELDPASLPTNLDELVDPGDSKLGNHNLDNAENCSSPKIPQSRVKATIDSEENLTPIKNEKSDIEREASAFRRFTRGSSHMLNDHGQVDAVQYKNGDDGIKDMRDCNFTQPKGSFTSGDAAEKINTLKKCEKNDLTTDCLKPRRSPRDLSRKGSQVNPSQHNTREDSKKHSVSNKYEKHGSFGNTEGSHSFSPPVGNMHLHERDGSTIGVTKSSTPMSLARRTLKLECYDFKREKSEDKFEVDQIWALYGRDGMPKDYAQVKKIESAPDFRLHVALLEVCSMAKDLKLPLCCGIFKVKSGQTKVVSCNVVSHQLRAEPIGKNRYAIYPRKGEVWAIYKSWKPADSDLGKGERDIAEVLEDNEMSIKVVVLSCVSGSKSLYRTPRSQRSTAGVIEIPKTEFARFSHQIPAFQHTGEEDSHWRGYWEVDPLAIPGVICLE
ncbi:hypothetical protein REPUB_Repub06bG0061700 [Reevesia pubescens]